jgi:putative Ca2+/H+ antiporter (TMEM165/GDT1 family)
MQALLVSLGVVAVAEIGDKTQLLAIVLAARYRAPVLICLGILLATIANHALAAAFGGVVADWIGPAFLRWILAAGFLAMAAWVLVPDRMDDGPSTATRAGAFMATLVSFFLVEIGDKTQIATIALAARYHDIVLVTIGTTLGMMAANVPAVWLGEVAATKLPMRPMRFIAAAIFAALGLGAAFNLGGVFH